LVRPTPSERPTVPPPFNVAKFAKDSDAKLKPSRPVEEARDDDSAASAGPPAEARANPPSAVRLITRPNLGTTPTDEAWARGMSGAPHVILPRERLTRLPLGHRAGFLLSLMDGATDMETLIALAPMPRAETLRIARDLFESGVIGFR
jgi:hypothetical protein